MVSDGSGSSWQQLGQDIDGEAADDHSAFSVSLSADGKILAIGSPGHWSKGDRPGYTRVY